MPSLATRAQLRHQTRHTGKTTDTQGHVDLTFALPPFAMPGSFNPKSRAKPGGGVSPRANTTDDLPGTLGKSVILVGRRGSFSSWGERARLFTAVTRKRCNGRRAQPKARDVVGQANGVFSCPRRAGLNWRVRMRPSQLGAADTC